MSAFERKKQSSPTAKNEIRLSARPVSRGVVVGKIICLHGRARQFFQTKIGEPQIKTEIRRLRSAFKSAARRLAKLSKSKSVKKTDRTKANIFDAHLLMLEDASFRQQIEAAIGEQKINAEWAVKTVSDEYIAKYKSIPDEYLRERFIDLEDVADRILNALGGDENDSETKNENFIIVAKEVKPSTLIELSKNNPLAVVAENGGWTSHTFILAREMNLPAVTGVKRISRRVKTGDEIIVDALNGQVILNPTEATLRQYRAAANEFQAAKTPSPSAKKIKHETLDGVEIKIRANLDLADGYARAKSFGAAGIGLYRSEFLFNQFKGFPAEKEQIKNYRQIARAVGTDGIRIRTFDLSVEQLTDETAEKEKNPALGLRAVRLSFLHLKEFKTQLRAILQASTKNNVGIVLPMISDVAEILRARQILNAEKAKLKRKKIRFGAVEIGAMIEIPSAVLTVDEIAAEADFLCLGTNDLVQYLLAVDRDNETVADWFRTLHPSVLRSIKLVLAAAERRKIPVVVCGEMAGSPAYTPILLGLGVREFSMNMNSIRRVGEVISKIAFEECFELVSRLERCRTTDEIEKTANDFYVEKWSHLFDGAIFPPKTLKN